MPARIRITLLFGLIVCIILALVCGSVYYFSYTNRIKNIQTRLTNRAITTARLLTQTDYFNVGLLKKIDSSTMMAMSDKTLQVYDYNNKKIYTYSDAPNDTMVVDEALLNAAKTRNNIFFTIHKKEAVVHNYVSDRMKIVVVSAAYDEDAIKKLEQLKWILWLSFGAGTIITFTMGYLFSRGLLQPIKKIADDINEISARNLKRRIETGNTRDEWHYLSVTINSLLNRLQESFETQGRFIANASHELSTPLTSISSQLEISLQNERNAEQYRNIVQSVYDDVKHLSKLTQTLLEFAQASGDPGGIVIEKVRIDEILMRLPADVRKTNSNYSVILAFDNLPENEEKLIVSGNAELLFLAIKNIVSNACKYSDDHKAAVQLTAADTAVVIIISDNGIGIPQHELDNIFQPFYRVHHAVSPGGFGLGLSLSTRIIKLHKGNISVESAEGKGTKFTVVLPNLLPCLRRHG